MLKNVSPHKKQLNDWIRSEIQNGGFPKVRKKTISYCNTINNFRIKTSCKILLTMYIANVTIYIKHEESVDFKIDRNSRIGKLINKYCKENNVINSSIKFIFDGLRTVWG